MAVPALLRRLSRRIGAWPLWLAPWSAALWVITVVSFAAGLLGIGLVSTPWRTSDVVCCAVLLACGAVCLEAVRSTGEPAGVAKDLASAWTMPVALLLPPVYSLLVPVPFTLLRQFRVRGGLVHRRVYSLAAIGLANAAASVVFHHSYDGIAALLHLTAAQRTTAVLVGLACATVGAALNIGLVTVAVVLSSPGTSWREPVGTWEHRVLDAGEICLGVVVASCWVASPALALTMLVPVLLVQRSLTHAQLRAAARTDAKTGLLNAQAWQEEAEREIVRAHRERQPLAVLVADLDHFKRINDAHGHLAGDTALLGAVQALLAGLRPYDQLGRFGGEEFTVVLPRTSRGEAQRIAERLRRAVAASPVLLAEDTVHLTVSIGVAVLEDHGDDLTDLLTAADHALYLAKQDGRDRVAVAPGEPLGSSGHAPS